MSDQFKAENKRDYTRFERGKEVSLNELLVQKHPVGVGLAHGRGRVAVVKLELLLMRLLGQLSGLVDRLVMLLVVVREIGGGRSIRGCHFAGRWIVTGRRRTTVAQVLVSSRVVGFRRLD